jgi:amphi-Trp domain-containing protein
MKRRKCRFVDQRNIEACIDQLQSIIDGLRAGSMAVEEEDQALLLRPRGPLDFEVRVDQLGTKETLRVEMSWKLASQRTAGANAAPASGPREVSVASAWEGPITRWPQREPAQAKQDCLALAPRAEAAPAAGSFDAEAAEMEVQEADILDEGDAVSVTALRPLKRTGTACTCSARSMEDPISSWPQERSIAEEYHQLYADACTVGSDGQWHIDRDRLVQSLANAGVDPLTQQELYSLALQADVDRTSLFSERVVAALERASQRPLAAVG